MGRATLTAKQKKDAGTFLNTRVVTRFKGLPVADDADPPAHFDEFEASAWRDFVDTFRTLDIIDQLNMPAINLLAIVYARILAGIEAEDENVADIKSFQQMIGAFGATPKHRGNYVKFSDSKGEGDDGD